METSALTKRFGGQSAVEDLTLKIGEGEVFGFLGPNGAGKTTTVRILSCLISKTSGDALVAGLDVSKPQDAMRIREAVGVLPEEVGLYESLSPYRNLDFYGRMYAVPEAARRERIQRLLEMLGLWDKKDAPVYTFSKGMKQKVAIARAVVHDPKIVFLDEPTANLDPEASKSIRDFILKLKQERRTVFLNTHRLDEAARVCDRVGVLKTRLMALGTFEELRRSLWGRRTFIQLRTLTQEVLAAARKAGKGLVEVDGSSMTVEVDDPTEDNPALIESIASAGGKILYVNDLSPSLEDVYLKLLRGGGGGGA